VAATEEQPGKMDKGGKKGGKDQRGSQNH